MNAKEIEKSSPFLLNRNKWKRIKELSIKKNTCSCSNNTLTFHAVHLYYKTINKVEYGLMNDQAKDCCYSIGSSLYEFDGYYVFVGSIDNVEDYWKEKLKDSSISETIEVPEKYFEDDYFERYTRQLKKLDITYVVNYYKIVKQQMSGIGIPMVSTFKEIAKDAYGIDDDKLFSTWIDKLKELYDDPLWIIPSFTCSSNKLCLQDIVKHCCQVHDKGTYSFKYKVNGISICSTLEIVSDTICTVRFYTEEFEDKDHYMYLNHKLDYDVVKKIYDNSSYWTTKIEPDLID